MNGAAFWAVSHVSTRQVQLTDFGVPCKAQAACMGAPDALQFTGLGIESNRQCAWVLGMSSV